MPFGDRTGPLGLGPMTGRAAGYCAGYNMPGFANPNFGFGRGFRKFWRGRGPRGRGFGKGFGRMTMVNPRGLLRPRFRRFAPIEQIQQAQPEPQPYQVWEPVPTQQPIAPIAQPQVQPTKEQELQVLKQELEEIEQEEQELNEEQKALKQEQEQIRKRLEELKQQ